MTEVESIAVEVSEDHTVASVHLKELAYDDFGSAETLRPHKVSRLFEMGRVLAMKGGLMEGGTLVSKDHTLFVLGLHYSFHPALWTVRRGSTFPHRVETQLTGMGQSSASLQSRLVNTLDNKTLATLDFRYVYVNRQTGRSTPFPPWVLEKYCRLKDQPQMRLTRESPQVPPSAYMYEVRVSESDMDHNHHTNQASYLRFCCDATHAAVKEGRLPRLQPSPWHFPLLKLEALHAAETWMGDRLQVFLWQQEQEDCRDTVRCVVVVKKNTAQEEEKVVFHTSMVYGQQSHL